MPQFEHLEQPTLVDRVFDDLREAIMCGRLAPKTRVSDARIATDMGVSRAPVREAIRRLAAQGLITEEPRRGAFVNTLSRRSVRELYDCRRALESLAARRLATERTVEGLEELRATIAEMRDLAKQGDRLALARIDHRFHSQLCSLTANSWLERLYGVISDQMWLVLRVNNVAHPPDDVNEMADIHQPILEAIEDSNPERAATAVIDHIDIAERLFLKEAAGLLEDGDAPA